MAVTLDPLTAASDGDRYLELIHRYPLHRIRDDADYEAATSIMYSLTESVERGEPLDSLHNW
jgi:hypothetical protein